VTNTVYVNVYINMTVNINSVANYS